MSMRCPICKKEVQFTDPEMPFCSERCRLIDLGKWSSGEYVISTPVDPSELSTRLHRNPSGSGDEGSSGDDQRER